MTKDELFTQAASHAKQADTAGRWTEIGRFHANMAMSFNCRINAIYALEVGELTSAQEYVDLAETHEIEANAR